jgi:serine/threonine protein kinase
MLHESGRTRVTRLFLPGRAVIRKPLGPDAVERLEHERSKLERLRGLDGVAQLVDATRYPDSIVLADIGGTSTAALVQPLAVDDLIRLAVALARAVAEMHWRGVMHRDITRANVVVSGDGVPCLVDFALAASVAEMRPEFTHHSELVGTLAYLAPEQTGRIGRPVDRRADLYAVGATLYELATGGPPFGTGNPLRSPTISRRGCQCRPTCPTRRYHGHWRRSSCIRWSRNPTTATKPPTAWYTTWSG